MKLSEQARARELYAQGISRQVIATRLGASRSAVTKWTADMPAPEKPCTTCNESFRPNRTNQRYCSAKCSRHQDYEVWKAQHTSPPPERPCAVCGRSLPATQRSPTALLFKQVSGQSAKPSKLPRAESRQVQPSPKGMI